MLDLDFTPLSEQEVRDAPRLPEQLEVVPIIPVPVDAPPMNFQHPQFGPPSEEWAYVNADERIMGYMLRFDVAAGHKHYCPVTYCKFGETCGWRAKGFPTPYPLYNAYQLASRPNDPVLIVHGEKVADAAQYLFPQFVVTTSPFGYGLAHNADWSALAGREVIICPDHSETGGDMVKAYAAAISEVSPHSIRMLPPKLFATSIWNNEQRVRRPAIPSGWDLHDARAEGWTPERAAAELRKAGDLKRVEVPLKLNMPGVTDFYLTDDGIVAEKRTSKGSHREWISQEFKLVALARDVDGMNWAKKIRFSTADGQIRDIFLPAALLAGEAITLREALLYAGLRMSGTRFARESLTEYLSRCSTNRRMLLVDRIGWHDGVFVTAGRTCGKHPSGEPVEYTGTEKSKVGKTACTLEGWQTKVAFLAAGSSALVFAISCGLAAPLIDIAKGESGGFHFVGGSSIGKTTALQVAGSVWGGGGVDGYLKSWRATSNGLEGIAAAHCDVLLCLDEIGQVRGSEVGQCAYMLANGTGKVRANRLGGSRPPMTWRVMILSSGELTLEAKVREDRGQSHAAAGQLVRFVDLAVDEGHGIGMFGPVASHENREAFARALEHASAENYGHAGLAFTDYLSSDIEVAADTANNLMTDFIASLGLDPRTAGQVLRVARRFALVSAAGEMAILAKIVPWNTGTAQEAARAMFQCWINSRGGFEANEEIQALEQVRYFLNKNSGNLDFAGNNESVINSAGFTKKLENEGWCYCFPKEVWDRDVCQGLDPQLVARVLYKNGHLVVDAGRLQKQLRFVAQRKWVYAVKETLLAEVAEENGSRLSVNLEEKLRWFGDQ